MEDKTIANYFINVLRNEPEELSLSLSKKGWISWKEFFSGVEKYFERDLSKEKLESILKENNKGRLEITENRLRATTGHTTEQVTYDYKEPPEKLFYSSSRNDILTEGIRSKDGGYIQVYDSPRKALEGRPRLKKPTIFSIKSKKGWNNGVVFYYHLENWYCKEVPRDFIGEMKNADF